MSRRTAKANKAIADAWERELQLVSEGLGTRDWTPEQQKDILDRGKAYDDNGKAFEGHHMKSVEEYPEYQGDSDNIQFLSRPEHRAAHNGNFQIPTNGYYNPITGETNGFGESIYQPCAVIELSNPIKDRAFKEDEFSKKATDSKSINSANPNSQAKKDSRTKKTTPKQGADFDELIRAAKDSKIGQFLIRNKEPIKTGIKAALVFVVGYAIEYITQKSGSTHADGEKQYDRSLLVESSLDSASDPVETDGESVEDTALERDKRASPVEHTVPGHGQHYWKCGQRVWIEKEDYSRGGNKSEEQHFQNTN